MGNCCSPTPKPVPNTANPIVVLPKKVQHAGTDTLGLVDKMLGESIPAHLSFASCASRLGHRAVSREQFDEACDRRGKISRIQLSAILRQGSPSSDNGTIAEWEFLSESGWTAYELAEASFIELCFRTKRKCEVHASQFTYDLLFDPSWSQTNRASQTARQIRRFVVSWQCKTEAGWSPCDAATGIILSERYSKFRSGKHHGKLSGPIYGYTCNMDFVGWKLYNTKLGTTRDIRRCTGDAAMSAAPKTPALPRTTVSRLFPSTNPTDYTWEVQLDHGWAPFEPPTAALLEANHTSYSETSFTFHQVKYRINWQKMVQVNKDTNGERYIRRTPPPHSPQLDVKVVNFTPSITVKPKDIMQIDVDGKALTVMAPSNYKSGDSMQVRIPLKRVNSYESPEAEVPEQTENVVWEWQKSPDEWVLYEDQTNAAMEQAYQSKSSFFFRAGSRQYTIDWKDMQQRDPLTGNSRTVRRRSPIGSNSAAPKGPGLGTGVAIGVIGTIGTAAIVDDPSGVGKAVTKVADSLAAADLSGVGGAAINGAGKMVNKAADSLAAADLSGVGGAAIDGAGKAVNKAADSLAAADLSGVGDAAINGAGKTVNKAADSLAAADLSGVGGVAINGAGKAVNKAADSFGSVVTVKTINRAGAILIANTTSAAQTIADNSGAVGDYGKAIGGVVAGAAVSFGSFVIDHSGAVGGAISEVADLASKIPIFGVLAQFMSDIGQAAMRAKYNKIAATQLKARTEELAVVLCDLFKSVALPISASIEVEIGRLQPLLKTALHYTDKFSKRSYISKLLQGDTMAEKLRLLDKELTDVVQSLSVSLQVTSIQMQKDMGSHLFSQLDDVAALVAKATAEGKSLDPNDPVVKQIAEKMDIKLDVVHEQLQFSLDEIKDSIKKSTETIEEKLDRLLAQVESESSAPVSAAPAAALGERRLYPPEDPCHFWNDFFDMKKVTPEEFIPVFEEEFLPHDGSNEPKLDNDERATLVSVIDAFPVDGFISIIEWKRFCSAVARSKMSMIMFIQSLTDEDESNNQRQDLEDKLQQAAATIDPMAPLTPTKSEKEKEALAYEAKAKKRLSVSPEALLAAAATADV